MSESRFPRPPQRTSPVIWFLVVLLLVLLALGGWLLRDRWRYLAAPPPGEAQRPMRTVTLYFAARDGSGLVAEDRQIDDCPPNPLKQIVRGRVDPVEILEHEQQTCLPRWEAASVKTN